MHNAEPPAAGDSGRGSGGQAGAGGHVPPIGTGLVMTLAKQATAGDGRAVIAVRSDPPDDAVVIQLTSWAAANRVHTETGLYGLNSRLGYLAEQPAVRVLGWSLPGLHVRLACTLGAVDALSATVQRRCTAAAAIDDFHRHLDPADLAGDRVLDIEDWLIVAHIEAQLRCAPVTPATDTPVTDDVATALALVTAADTRYNELLSTHIDIAERAIAGYRRALHDGQEPSTAGDQIIDAVTSAADRAD